MSVTKLELQDRHILEKLSWTTMVIITNIGEEVNRHRTSRGNMPTLPPGGEAILILVQPVIVVGRPPEG